MAKESGSKTIWIIIAVVLGILIICGLLFGYGCYYLYKVGSSTESPTPSSVSTLNTANWKYYNNARFKYTLNFPNTFAEEESVNGDGATLTMGSPAITIRVYGTANSGNQTLDDYLNAARTDLFKGSNGAEEIAADVTTLGGVPAQERRWQYNNPTDGTKTVMDQVTTQKGENFYTVQMVISYQNYAEYAPMFDEILKTFKFV